MFKKLLLFSTFIVMSFSILIWTLTNASVNVNHDFATTNTINSKNEMNVALQLCKTDDTNCNYIKNKKNEIENNIKKEKTTKTPYKEVYKMESTAYTGDAYTTSGITPTRNKDGISTIAVDPNIIPLGSRVYIPGYGEAIAADTGSAIKGNVVDLYLNSYDECIEWGRQPIDLYILEYPKEQ